MPKFRKKPLEIEAWQYIDGDICPDELLDVLCNCERGGGVKHRIHVHTLEGPMTFKTRDWIIKGIEGEFYPCKASIFEQTYEPADAEAERNWRRRL